MEDNETKKSEVKVDDGLRLIDVASENPTSYEFSGHTQYCDDEIPVSSIEEKEQVLQPHESPKPEKVMKKGKYKSCLGQRVLHERVFGSSMMENNHKSVKKGLPTIQEDINRSTESTSTFRSDCIAKNSQDFVLFEDVISSIRRSAKASDAATPGKLMNWEQQKYQ